jgi:ornithine cyclodeaminase/thiomorpholine-carboxylate dehydrogenase
MTGHVTEVLALSHADVVRLVAPERALEALAEGFKALSAGHVQAPARLRIEVPGKGFSLAMLAWSPGSLIALKTVSVFEGNRAMGLESHQALLSLFDAATGVPVALLDGGSITAIRTTAAAVLSVRTLARPDARIATVVGAGVQGREHVRQLHLARPFDEIRVFARNEAEALGAAKGVAGARVVSVLEAAVRGADVVCLTTSSATPVIRADWVRPGTHVTSVGFAPPGSEVPPELIERARIFVEARTAFEPAPVGCAELAGREASGAAEIGEVLAGSRPGRTCGAELTLYKSMGIAMEDMVVANLAFAEAQRTGAGTRLRF